MTFRRTPALSALLLALVAPALPAQATLEASRRTAIWNMVCSPSNGSDCLGRSWRESGQRRVPPPPAMITA